MSGLSRSILNYYIDFRSASKYTQLLVDVNLFWRILKIFNNIPSLNHYRQSIFLTLGIWHCHKQMKEVIWQYWMGPWLGQAWHALFPRSRVFTKISKLSQLTTFLTWLRHAWKEIKDLHSTILEAIEQQYASTIADIDEDAKNTLHYYGMRLLDLRTMFTFAIPLVSNYDIF